MNILFITHFFVGFMVSEIPRVSLFVQCQYSVTFPYIFIQTYLKVLFCIVSILYYNIIVYVHIYIYIYIYILCYNMRAFYYVIIILIISYNIYNIIILYNIIIIYIIYKVSNYVQYNFKKLAYKCLSLT